MYPPFLCKLEVTMLKYISFFSGIGAFEKALDNLGVEYELVNYCEIDKHASKSYAAVHGVDESLNLGDITTVDTSKLPKDIDLLTHGSPCQSFSLAGLQHGGDKGSGTRSSLMWETVRIISDIKPKIIIWENVKNVLSKKHKHNFDAYIEQLDELNYNSYHKILNSRDFGIPQNRERIFVISIRKDIDNGKFKFPEPFELKLRLKDVLEDKVDEKYYITNEQATKIINWKAYQKPFERVLGKESISPCLTARGAGEYHSGMIIYSPENKETTNMQLQVKEATIQRIDIPQTVKVRKYVVDTDSLCSLLRESKKNVSTTNKDIAEALNVPHTKVEHWFRQDDCFAIPDADIWMELKELLKIETDEFDEAIMTFEEKEGVYEKSERHYFADGIAPTLTSTSAGNEKILVREATKKGYAEAVEGDSINFEQPNSKTRRGRVGKQIAQTLNTSPQQGVVVNE